MAWVSVTRLRIRSIRFLPAFLLHAWRSERQVRKSPGFEAGSLLPDRRRTFWTLTLWADGASMRDFMASGAHRIVMPKLLDWCDEASIVHWEQPEQSLPSWADATRRMREEGRPSRVRHPSPHHADMSFAEPRLARATPIQPRQASR